MIEATQLLAVMQPILAALREGRPARTAIPEGEEENGALAFSL